MTRKLARGNSWLWSLGAAAAIAALWARHRRRRRFAGQLALVTGGSRGLGLQLAAELGRRGATLVLCARDEAELERATRLLAREGIDAYAVPCDVTDREAVAAMIAAVEDAHGPIDVLVNAAGILHVGPATAMTVEDLHAAMDTNFWGAVHTIDAVLPGMLAGHRGQIANIASIGGISPVPWMLPYSASKAALTGYSLGLHHDLAREGIAVTTIAPWVMRTGGPINVTYKGSARRGAYLAFALADLTPGLAISATRAAVCAVDGIASRRALVRVGLQSKLLAMAFGIMPGVVSSVLATVVRALPVSFTHGGSQGRALARELGPTARAVAERSRARNNQPVLDPE